MSGIEDDIVWRLRHQAKTQEDIDKLLKEAAAEIERLRKSVEWLYKN